MNDHRLVDVRLAGVPLRRHLAMLQHQDAVVREFTLITLDEHPSALQVVPQRVLASVDDLRRRYADLSLPLREAAREAQQAGREEFDLTARVPAQALAAAVDLGDLFDEADDFCREGDLLTLAAPPEVSAHRRWLIGRLSAQLRYDEED